MTNASDRKYHSRVVAQLSVNYANQFAGLAFGADGAYFACDGSIWRVADIKSIFEYARVKEGAQLRAVRLDGAGNIYVGTADGLIYKVTPERDGSVVGEPAGGGSAELFDIAFGHEGKLYASMTFNGRSGVFRVGKWGDYEVLPFDGLAGTKGILFDDRDNALWCFQPAEAALVKVALAGGAFLTRLALAAQATDFYPTFANNDGVIARDDAGHLYVLAGCAGAVVRVDVSGQSEVIITGLSNPVGIAIEPDEQNIFVLESATARLMRFSLED